MKNQAIFSSKDKSNNLKCRLLQFLFGALRVKLSLLSLRIWCTDKCLMQGKILRSTYCTDIPSTHHSHLHPPHISQLLSRDHWSWLQRYMHHAPQGTWPWVSCYMRLHSAVESCIKKYILVSWMWKFCHNALRIFKLKNLSYEDKY